MTLICHILIGPPGSGKSTFASQLAQLGHYSIISTDQIRQTLYGDPTIQGEWSVIEQEVLHQIRTAIASNQPVIYDATNAKRVWRMSLLMQLQQATPKNSQQHIQPIKPGISANIAQISTSPTPLWMAWHLKTPLETCKLWNQQRSRQVLDPIIETMFQSLHDFPPVPAEGFAAVNPINLTNKEFNLQLIQNKIHRLSHTLINRTNRTQHRQITLHPYSRLLDFDRLLHLIALIVRYPGIGNLQFTAPKTLENLFGSIPNFATSLAEIAAVMAKLKGSLYADTTALALDLEWLEQNGLIGSTNYTSDIQIKAGEINKESDNFATHPYSDIEPFKRLLATIRFILHHPFLANTNQGNLPTLVNALKAEGIVVGDALDTVRKDIEKVLKPYQILPQFPLRQGYFSGTAILSRHELRKVFGVLQTQAKSFADPVALLTYELFRDRLLLSKIDSSDVYPVRAIAITCMVDPEFLPSCALSHQGEKLEEAIASGQLLELNKLPGGGRFPNDKDVFFTAWPLQIVFYNHAWYLAFEREDSLFQFERLDRLFMGQPHHRSRSQQAQEKSLHKLQRLHQSSAGLFLGTSVQDQQLFLSTNKSERSQVEITVELWFNDIIFRFISEGTKRYPPSQMKMSPPLLDRPVNRQLKSIFSLPKTDDPNFPNRFRVTLPKWSLHDVDLWRWIAGFGGQVKVVQPQELVDKIKRIGTEICWVYE